MRDAGDRRWLGTECAGRPARSKGCVLCSEGVVTHTGPESCIGTREGGGEVSVGERTGQPSNHESELIPGADAVPLAEGNTDGRTPTWNGIGRLVSSSGNRRRSSPSWPSHFVSIRGHEVGSARRNRRPKLNY